MDEKNIQLFEDNRIRTAWDEKNEEWLFSVVDNETVIECNALKIGNRSRHGQASCNLTKRHRFWQADFRWDRRKH